MTKTFSRFATASLLMMLMGCATPPAELRSTSSGEDPDIQVTAPGRASCKPTPTEHNHIGASAANSVRANAGLPPLRANALLARAAAEHACDMAQRGRMSHHGSTTTGPAQRVKAQGYAPKLTAENIAAGPFDLNRVLAEWNRSDGHLRNTLLPQTREFGIGQAIGSDGRTRYWSAVYAAPRGQ